MQGLMYARQWSAKATPHQLAVPTLLVAFSTGGRQTRIRIAAVVWNQSAAQSPG